MIHILINIFFFFFYINLYISYLFFINYIIIFYKNIFICYNYTYKKEYGDNMNIDSIAIVRATNFIPFDGIIKPLSNAPYLTKDLGSHFSNYLSDLLKDLEITPKYDPTRLFEKDYYDKLVKENGKIVKDYLPYVSDYNSIVLFAINSICPDDNENGFGNNTFSNKRCAIIEPLKPHIEQVISLHPTDTSIKGNVHLSNDAIILIEEDALKNLSSEEKSMLASLNLTIRTFKGSLKTAVFETLKNSNKYFAETLSLSSENDGIIPSETSDQLKQILKDITHKLGITQTKFFHLVQANDKTLPKYEEFKDEFKNALIVKDYYIKIFLEKLLIHINAPQELQNKIDLIIKYPNQYMPVVINLIKQFGIKNYKEFVDNYNNELKIQQANGNLPTPNQIIDNLKAKII